MNKNQTKKLLNKAIFITAGVLLTSCSVVHNRIEDAREVPQANLTGVASSYTSDPKIEAVLDNVIAVWKDEQQRVRRASLHKMQLLPWINKRLKESYQEYKVKSANPEFSQAQYEAFIKSEAVNQAALSVADKIIHTKEYRARNLDGLYYLLGTQATEEGIAIAQIGLNWDYLARGKSELFITTETFTNTSGNTVQLIRAEKRQTSGVNLLDDIMNEVDGSVSYSKMKARGISDTEITAFSAFVRYFSENENVNLPLLGPGVSDRGHRRKIYASLWAAMRATTIPVSPDGRLLTPPNGIKIEPLYDNNTCNPSNPLKDKNGIAFFVCKLQARSANDQMLDSSLRVRTIKASTALGGGSQEEAAARNYANMVYGNSATARAGDAPRSSSLDFKFDSDPVLKSVDFQKSDMEVFKTAIRQLGNDGWDRIMGAAISSARGGAVGAAFAAAIPGFTASEGFALGVATNAINYAFNSWIKKERLSETQIAESVAVIKLLTAQVNGDGILDNKFPAYWVVIPEGQSTPDGSPVEGGVRLVWGTDIISDLVDALSSGGRAMSPQVSALISQLTAEVGSLYTLTFADVAGRKLVQENSIKIVNTGPSTMSLQDLISGQSLQGSTVSSRYSPARVRELTDRFEGKSNSEIIKGLVNIHVQEQLNYNFMANKEAFSKYMNEIMTAFVFGNWNKMDQTFYKEFGIQFSDLHNAQNIEDLDLVAIASNSKIFKGNVIGLKMYFNSVKKYDSVKEDFTNYAQAVYENIMSTPKTPREHKKASRR